ncbi:hypothetical protein IU459_32625 [Nocardia amamiensis]|uniref:Uncharacterized protein n=1 Tax=Nocardia amamiensis TaxID=404578 RepID=A0ABS0D0E9_9NOCA|nr:hypothetical protein [Nocardia amamiensis]MBF6302250.1 hypothetical protein [Nocardia amamiensis]
MEAKDVDSWEHSIMVPLHWIAASDLPRGSALVDWLPVLAPVGVIAAAFIAAVVARWNVRKPPHEHLETLVQLYRDWPEELEGKETIERQIALQLAEMRVATDDAGQPEASSDEHAAEQRVLTRARRILINRAVAIGLVSGSLVAGIVASTVYEDHTPPWFTALGVTATTLGAAIYFLNPRTLALLRYIRTASVDAARSVLTDRVKEAD